MNPFPLQAAECSSSQLLRGILTQNKISRIQLCCGGRIRTDDLEIMSLASYHCSTPRYNFNSDIIRQWINNFNQPSQLGNFTSCTLRCAPSAFSTISSGTTTTVSPFLLKLSFSLATCSIKSYF